MKLILYRLQEMVIGRLTLMAMITVVTLEWLLPTLAIRKTLISYLTLMFGLIKRLKILVLNNKLDWNMVGQPNPILR